MRCPCLKNPFTVFLSVSSSLLAGTVNIGMAFVGSMLSHYLLNAGDKLAPSVFDKHAAIASVACAALGATTSIAIRPPAAGETSPVLRTLAHAGTLTAALLPIVSFGTESDDALQYALTQSIALMGSAALGLHALSASLCCLNSQRIPHADVPVQSSGARIRSMLGGAAASLGPIAALGVVMDSALLYSSEGATILTAGWVLRFLSYLSNMDTSEFSPAVQKKFQLANASLGVLCIGADLGLMAAINWAQAMLEVTPAATVILLSSGLDLVVMTPHALTLLRAIRERCASPGPAEGPRPATWTYENI